MKSLIILFLVSFPFFSLAQGNHYLIQSGQSPVLVPSSQAEEGFGKDVKVCEDLRIRFKIKKAIVTKDDSGWKVRFEPICEKDSSIPVEDLRDGGGVIVEKLIGKCMATYKGEEVTVAVSGMVYDNSMRDFSDESKNDFRNFFTHLQVFGTRTIFGIGDFNLGHTKALPFESWVSELSTAQGGGGNPGGELLQTREDFVASIRFGE